MSARARRVLIRTLPLENGNYGGILQAYALQQALNTLGYDAVTDATRSDRIQGWLGTTKRSLRHAGVRWEIPRVASPARQRVTITELVKVHQDEFVATHINTTRLYRGRGRVRTRLLEDFDAFVVGSDQVWRKAYGDVRSYLFDFLPNSDRPRVAYAASFGRDDIDEYDSRLHEEARALAQAFTAISVREVAGIEICSRQWGVQAELHVDPTMLLPYSHYDALARASAPLVPRGNVGSYVLDDSETVSGIIRGIERELGREVSSMMPRLPASYREFRKTRNASVRPTVGSWLGAFRDASFVITDSFHGAVFSILSNTPFLVVTNRGRGASRFDTLLETFGMSDRQFHPGGRVPELDKLRPIDWGAVNGRIALERARGFAYLERSLRTSG